MGSIGGGDGCGGGCGVLRLDIADYISPYKGGKSDVDWAERRWNQGKVDALHSWPIHAPCLKNRRTQPQDLVNVLVQLEHGQRQYE